MHKFVRIWTQNPLNDNFSMVNYKWVTGFAWKNQVKTSFLKLKLDFQLLGKSVSSNYGSTTLDGMVIYHLNHSY